MFSSTIFGTGMKVPCNPLPLSGSFDPVLIRSDTCFFLPSLICQAAFAPADRFLALDTTQFAFGNKPSLAADCAQHTTARYFLPKTLHHLLLRFVRSKFNSYSQVYSHPFFSAFMHKGRCVFSLALWCFSAYIYCNLPCANWCGLFRSCLSPPKYTLKNLQYNRNNEEKLTKYLHWRPI